VIAHMTVQAAIAKTAEELRAAGIGDPIRDARLLVAKAMDLDLQRLTLHLADDVHLDHNDAFYPLLLQRLKRVPMSHILGTRLFYGRTFAVTPDVLDPRPDTEALVGAALAEPFQSVLDLGTGSGAIVVSLLAERPAAVGIATDISRDALAVAAQNADALGVSSRLEFEVSNWFSYVGGCFDLIVSNPPYIAATEMTDLQPEVRDHEPRIALTDEADGLTHYRHIIAHHDPYLTEGGRLMVEIGPTQALAVSQMMQGANLNDITVIPDLDGRDRVVWGRKLRKTA